MKSRLNNSILKMMLLGLTSFMIVSCEKDNDTDEPKAVITVTTTSISTITPNSAKSGGNMTVTGNAAVDGKGVCWSTTQNPTIQNSKTADGTGYTAYVSNMTGLNGSTTYYVRAYVTYNKGIVYGNEISFTTSPNPIKPTVTTSTVSSITQTTATVGGDVTSDGGATVTERGICYSKSLNPTIENATKIQIGNGLGAFSSSLTNLTINTTYYVRAYAINSVGISYGNEVSFVTPPAATLASVTTSNYSELGAISVKIGGTLTSNGNTSIYQYGVCYSKTNNPPTISDVYVYVTSNLDVNSSYTFTLSNLQSNTKYYYRAVVSNTAGIAYGEVKEFTTSNITVGMSYQDGIVGYILKSGDTGYVAGEIHGLLVKSEDQSSGTTWENAKTLCSNLGTGWYLPNFTELYNIWTNRNVIGGFISGRYWSSDINYTPTVDYIKCLYFNDGSNEPTYKTQTFVKVRAVKTF